MEKKKILIIRIILICLSALFIVGGFTTFFVIKSITPDYRFIKNNEDLTEKYEIYLDDPFSNVDLESIIFYTYEDKGELFSIEENKIEVDLNKIALNNNSYSKFRFTLSFNIVSIDNNVFSKDEYNNNLFTYSKNISNKSINLSSKGEISLERFTFEKNINDAKLIFSLTNKDSNLEPTIKFVDSSFKLGLLGAK